MIFVFFTIAAIITVIAAMKLSTYADVISEKSKWGGMMVGTILLAAGTSLPEVTTSLTAVALDNPNIAIGNVLGSNMFNLLIIASFDLYYRKERLFLQTSFHHTYTALLGMLLATMVFIALFIQFDWTIFGIGLDTLLLLSVYIIGIQWINRMEKMSTDDISSDESDLHTYTISLKRAKIGFVIAAIVILGSGSLLTITGDEIAVVTGIGSSFVGSFLIAASTSLPEAMAVLVALQLGNYNLALGSILGSNLFNMVILGISDLGYVNGPILQHVDTVHIFTAATVILLSAIVLFSVLRGRSKKINLYGWPSFLLVTLYFVSSYLIFIQ